MTYRAPLMFSVLLAMMVGCAAHPKAGNASASASPPPPGSAFEKMKDPPISAQTHFAAGQLAESQGQVPQALAQYQVALSMEPKYLDAMYRIGVIYAQLRDYPRAIETWNKYITASGGSATAYSNLGFCQELAGNPAGAEAAYRKGIALDGKNEPCRVNFGLMLARHGKPTDALRQLLAVLPPGKAHYDLASIYETQGKRQEAKAEYRKSLELDPDLGDAKSRLAALSD